MLFLALHFQLAVLGCGDGESGPEPEVLPTLTTPELTALRPRPTEPQCLAWFEGVGGLEPQRLLSQTGCFIDLETLAVADDMVPFGVLSPLWTDGAIKLRHTVLSPQEVIGFDAEQAWSCPLGTALVKTLIIERVPGDELYWAPLETRVMLLVESGLAVLDVSLEHQPHRRRTHSWGIWRRGRTRRRNDSFLSVSQR